MYRFAELTGKLKVPRYEGVSIIQDGKTTGL